ncbi:MAG: DUF4199 domain-containing protein [Prolixibacteraceae bacterium]|nr:DUF4199 domain-containing protein [Prolixibacteraceae bacterium]
MEQIINSEPVRTTEEKGNLFRLTLLYGGGIAIIYIAIALIFYFAKSMDSALYRFFGYLYWVAAVIFIQVQYRKSLGGYMKYGQAIVATLTTMFFASLIVGIFIYIQNKFIAPESIGNVMLATEEKLYEKGFSDDDISMSMQMFSRFMKPAFFAVMSVFSTTVTGLVIGIVTGFFTKKEKPIFE